MPGDAANLSPQDANPGISLARDSSLTRRRILDALLGVSLVAWFAVVILPILRFLKRPPEASAGSEISVGEEDARKIAQNGFAIVRFGTDRVIVFRGPEKQLHALQAKCTHEGCTVTYKADEALVWCACHNGKFAIDGRVISGPPPRPLSPYVVRGELSSKLTISRRVS